MFQTLLEEESDVNGIVNAAKPGFLFIERGLTGIEKLLYEGEGIGKW